MKRLLGCQMQDCHIPRHLDLPHLIGGSALVLQLYAL